MGLRYSLGSRLMGWVGGLTGVGIVGGLGFEF